MRRGRAIAIAALALLVAWGSLSAWGALGRGALGRGPQDIPATPFAQAPDPLRLVALGTSLTARGSWPAALAAELEACLARPVRLQVLARPGATSQWGQGQLEALAAARPDIVLIEFTANDADGRDGLALAQSQAAHQALLAGLQGTGTGAGTGARARPKVILMSMNPTHGLRGLLRWRHGVYRGLYRRLAAQDPDLGYLDLDGRWRQALRPWQRWQAIPDGLHPDPEIAQQLILPALTAAVSALIDQSC